MNKSHAEISISEASHKSARHAKEKKKRIARKIPHDGYEISKGLVDYLIENTVY